MAGFSGPVSAQSQLSPRSVITEHHSNKAVETPVQGGNSQWLQGPGKNARNKGWRSGGDIGDLEGGSALRTGAAWEGGPNADCLSGMLTFSVTFPLFKCKQCISKSV